MAHPKARLNVLGRELLVTRVTVMGWPAATAADAQGISRATAYKWVRRFRAEGAAGLADRSSRPHRSPRATPADRVDRILAARTEWRWGPDRLGPLLQLPPSTVAAVLRRAGVPRLADLDRPTGLPVRRYQACHPGELVHQDHKKLGRIPTAAATESSGGQPRRTPIAVRATTTSRHSSTTAAGGASSSRCPTSPGRVPRPRSRSPSVSSGRWAWRSSGS